MRKNQAEVRVIDADTVAFAGTASAMIALSLAVFRIAYQTHANGGYHFFNDTAWGVIWTAGFGFSASIAAASLLFIAAVIVGSGFRQK